MTPRRRLPFAAALLTLAVGVSTLLAGLSAPAPARAAQTGIVTSLDPTVDVPAAADDLGVGWVRVWAAWDVGEPARGRYDASYMTYLRNQVAPYQARGIKVLLVVSRTPGWAQRPGPAVISPPVDPSGYGNFVAHVLDAAPGIDAVEVWNEPDGPEYWANGPDPVGYADLLRATYPRVKASHPGVTVVTGGMVGNDFDFLQSLYDNGAGNSFDAVGVHTDMPCRTVGPGAYYRDPSGRIGRWSFTAYREVHDVMARHGDGDKTIWMTELGWSTESSAPGSCFEGAWAGKNAEGVSEADQARFLTDAYDCLATDPYVKVGFWFAIQDMPKVNTYARSLGLIRPNGSHKPAYAALKAQRNGAGSTARGCGGVVDHTAPTLDVGTPGPGVRFVDRIAVRATADDHGGTGVHAIQFFVDGVRRRWFTGSTATLKPWTGSRTLALGPHDLVFRASDNAGNVTERHVSVIKVAASALAPVKTATDLRLQARKRQVVAIGTLRRAGAPLPLGGGVRLIFQHRVTHKKWHRPTQWMYWRSVWVRASGSFRVALTVPRSGAWRVQARYSGKAPYTPSISPFRQLRIRR